MKWKQILIEYLVKLSPKPSDLAMGSLKLLEMEVEERTGDCGKNLGRSVARGKKPIELGNSWFSAKIMLVVRCVVYSYKVKHCMLTNYESIRREYNR